MLLLGITEKQYDEEMSPALIARLSWYYNAKNEADEYKQKRATERSGGMSSAPGGRGTGVKTTRYR